MICLDEFGPLNLQPQPGGKAWAPRAKPQTDPRDLHPPARRPAPDRRLRRRHRRLYGHIDRTQDAASSSSPSAATSARCYPADDPARTSCSTTSPRTRATQVREWAAANNVELAYTPFYASWLNRIEAQFKAPALLHPRRHRPPRPRHPGPADPPLHRLAQRPPRRPQTHDTSPDENSPAKPPAQTRRTLPDASLAPQLAVLVIRRGQDCLVSREVLNPAVPVFRAELEQAKRGKPAQPRPVDDGPLVTRSARPEDRVRFLAGCRQWTLGATTHTHLYFRGATASQGPWRGLEDVEFATLEWVDWFNHRRLFEAHGHIPPAEFEANHYRQQESSGQQDETQTKQPA